MATIPTKKHRVRESVLRRPLRALCFHSLIFHSLLSRLPVLSPNCPRPPSLSPAVGIAGCGLSLALCRRRFSGLDKRVQGLWFGSRRSFFGVCLLRIKLLCCWSVEYKGRYLGRSNLHPCSPYPSCFISFRPAMSRLTTTAAPRSTWARTTSLFLRRRPGRGMSTSAPRRTTPTVTSTYASSLEVGAPSATAGGPGTTRSGPAFKALSRYDETSCEDG